MKSRINILHINNNTNLGGQQQVFMNIARNIDKTKYKIDLLVYDDSGPLTDEIKKLGINIIKISSITKHFFHHVRELKKIYESGNYDIVHQHASNSGIFINVLLAKKMKIKTVIVHSHCEDSLDNSIIKRVCHKVFRKLLTKYSDMNISCSYNAGKWMFGEKKFNVISNGVELEKFSYNEKIRKKIRNKFNIQKDCFVLGNVGRLSYVKNQKFLIDLYNEYIKTNNNSKLVLVGNGPLRDDLENYAKKYNLDNNILFLGEIKDVNIVYNMFDLFLFPSFNEGQGISVLEALANGLSCISNKSLPRIDYTITEELDVSKWMAIITNNSFYRKNYNLYKYSNEIFIDSIYKLYEEIKNEKE